MLEPLIRQKELSGVIYQQADGNQDFATEITIHNAREQRMRSESAISQEHVSNNRAVRNTLLGRGIVPENLSPEEDVKKVERRLVAEDKKALKKPEALDE